jgi:hypothetical protein
MTMFLLEPDKLKEELLRKRKSGLDGLENSHPPQISIDTRF